MISRKGGCSFSIVADDATCAVIGNPERDCRISCRHFFFCVSIPTALIAASYTFRYGGSVIPKEMWKLGGGCNPTHFLPQNALNTQECLTSVSSKEYSNTRTKCGSPHVGSPNNSRGPTPPYPPPPPVALHSTRNLASESPLAERRYGKTSSDFPAVDTLSKFTRSSCELSILSMHVVSYLTT